ncbi:MAG: hypothetical protein PVH84_01955 [Candidatus Aminicenantes bacterium]|jgi:hypothetical protein
MRKYAAVFTVFFFCATVFVNADVYIKQQTHTDAFEVMGQSQPAKDVINHMWLADNKMASLSEDQSFIIDLEKSKVFWMNSQNKTYIEMDLPLDISKYLPEQAAQMMSNMNISVAVQPTDVTETIAGKTCKKYDVTMTIMMMMTMEMKMKVWATEDVPFDWKKFQDKMIQMFSPTMPLGEEALNAFKQIEGWQMRSEMTMNMMGADMKTVQEVVEITEKDAPAGTYTVPEGYTKQDKFSLEDMQRR